MNDDIENLDRLADELEGLRSRRRRRGSHGSSRGCAWSPIAVPATCCSSRASRRRFASTAGSRAPISRRSTAWTSKSGPARAAAARATPLPGRGPGGRRTQGAGDRPIPHQPSSRARARRGRDPHAAREGAAPREPRSAVRHGGDRAHPARPCHRRRRHRRRQDDDAGRAHRRHQPARLEAHHHTIEDPIEYEHVNHKSIISRSRSA